MPHAPDFEAFCKLAASADYVPVFRRVLSDVLTPVSAFHKIDDGGCACLFESVIGGEKVGRYSFLAAEPFLLLEALRVARGKDRAILKKVLSNGRATKGVVRECRRIFEDTGAIGAADRRIRADIEEAKRHLGRLKPSDARDMLFWFTDMLLNRNY